MASGKRRGPSAFLLIIVGVAALLTGWTAMNYRGGVPKDEDLSDRQKATATVVGCEQDGPFSVSGVGYWWTCEVDIVTENGKEYRQSMAGSRFEPSEKGKTVDLVSGGMGSTTWMRTDIPANNLATTVTAGGLLIGVICLLFAGHRVLRR
ncbi:MAG: DUF6346 domain-containing protein [Stackebrandtia sp.]